MNQQWVVGTLAAAVALSCGGETLMVDDDPDAGGGGSSAGSSAESSAESSGGAGGSSATTSSGGSSSGAGGSSSGTGGSSSGAGGSSSGAGGTTAASVSTGATTGGIGGGSSTGDPVPLPCDLFNENGYPCVAAHSTVRLLRADYDGPLYQICKGSAVPGPSSCQGEARDIGVVKGLADAAAQDVFCNGSSCFVTMVYDQSGKGNDLEPSPPGSAKPTPGNPVNASDLPTSIQGHEAYGILFRPGMGYRTACNSCNVQAGNGIPVMDEPQTIYMVTSQHDAINGCCFDYGNAEVTTNNDGNGTAEAVYFGQGVIWGTGSGDGPWVMADLENGLYPGWENGQDRNISTNTSLAYDFVTAVLVGDTAEKNAGKGRFALYGGDAQGGELKTMYDGIRPEKPGYVPMQKQGSVVLSIAGDNSDGDGGRFYEGVIVAGAAPKELIDALQTSIVAAGYGD